MKREAPDMERERREYYKRNVVFLALFLGFLPGVFVLGQLARLLGWEQGIVFIAVTWMAASVVAAFWRIYWRCPRCQKTFYYKWWYGNSFTTKCVHCGFRPGG